MPTYPNIVIEIGRTSEQAWASLTDPSEWRVWSKIQPEHSVLPLNPEEENDQFQLKVQTNEGPEVLRGNVVNADSSSRILGLHSMIDGNSGNAAVVEIKIVATSIKTSRIVLEYRAAGDRADEDALRGQYNLWEVLLLPFPGRLS